MLEREADLTIFSPRASAMGQHEGDIAVSTAWAQVCNDLIARVVGLYPDRFVGVCQLPQTAGESVDAAVAELQRCVGVGLRWSQSQSGPERRSLELSAADRPVLVPDLRGDGRARRARDGSCVGELHTGLPRHRRPLHQRRHHRFHAADPRRSVWAIPRRCGS